MKEESGYPTPFYNFLLLSWLAISQLRTTLPCYLISNPKTLRIDRPAIPLFTLFFSGVGNLNTLATITDHREVKG
jgi:hypothetical protein